MDFVLNHPGPDEDKDFESELNIRVGEHWYQAGLTNQLNGQHERAIERFEMAMATDVGNTLAAEAKLKSEAASP